MSESKDDFEVILGNSNPRFSGVTSTMLQTLDFQAQIMKIVVLGRHHLPAQHQDKAISFFELAKRCRSLLPSGKSRVFHARRNDEMIQALVLKYLFRAKIKIVFTSTAQRHHSNFTRWLMGKMDCIISTCEAAASYLGQRPAAIIPHGINAETYRPDASRRNNKVIQIAMFGRVRAQKGTHLFVRACINNFAKHSKAKAIIVGAISSDNQEFVSKLKQEIQMAGLSERIQFTGELPFEELPHLFQSSSLVAALSETEGFGLTILEAMSSGAAVLTSEAGAWPEIVKQGVHGYTVPIKDQHSVSKALDLLLSDEQMMAKMGELGRKRIEDSFRIEHESERLCELYKSIQA